MEPLEWDHAIKPVPCGPPANLQGVPSLVNPYLWCVRLSSLSENPGSVSRAWEYPGPSSHELIRALEQGCGCKPHPLWALWALVASSPLRPSLLLWRVLPSNLLAGVKKEKECCGDPDMCQNHPDQRGWCHCRRKWWVVSLGQEIAAGGNQQHLHQQIFVNLKRELFPMDTKGVLGKVSSQGDLIINP